MAAQLEIHLEWPHHAICLPEFWPDSSARGLEMTWALIRMLDRHDLRATFYVLGPVAEHHPALLQALVQRGHGIGSHGYWHRHGECEGDPSDQLARRFLPPCVGYRSPFWETTPRPCVATGGAAFHLLPYAVIKQAVQTHGLLYLHPHDLFNAHLGPLRRQLFFCDPWERLERLLTEVPWKK